MFLNTLIFLLLVNEDGIDPKLLINKMDEDWLTDLCSKITNGLETKYPWLKLKWDRISVRTNDFPKKHDENSFCNIVFVQKSNLQEAIKKLDNAEEVHSEEIPEFMKILNDATDEFVFVEIEEIDQGQFSIIKPFKTSYNF